MLIFQPGKGEKHMTYSAMQWQAKNNINFTVIKLEENSMGNDNQNYTTHDSYKQTNVI